MDIKNEQFIKLLKFWPLIIIVISAVIIVIIIANRKPLREDLIQETPNYEITQDPTTKIYEVELKPNFYNRSEEEILKDIEEMKRQHDAAGQELYVDVPMHLFPTTTTEQENEERVDPDFNPATDGYLGEP